MDTATQTAPPAAPWRNRMVPGTAPAPIYADDPPMYDGRRPAPSVTTADSAALAVLHAPASIASRRAAIACQDRLASGPPAEPDRTTGAAGTGESMSDFMQRAQEALTNEGNRWTPAEGDVLAGTLVRIRQIDGQYEKPFRVLTIRPMTGTSPMDVSEKTTLKEAFDEMEAHGLGCQVAIKYLGSRIGKTGGRYEAYTAYSEPVPAPAAAVVDTAAAVERERAAAVDNANRETAQRQRDALNTPATEPSPGYPQGGAGNTLATDAATMTAQAKAALANSDQNDLTRIGARARDLGLVWDRAAQCYNTPAPADAVL